MKKLITHIERLKNNDTIMLGEKGEYLALCKKCFLNKTKNDE